MKRKLLSLLVCAVLIAVAVVPSFAVSAVVAEAKTVYVASTGNDSNVGSESEPFLTFQKAWTNSDTGEYVIIVKDTAVLTDSSFVLGGQNRASATIIKGETPDSVLDLSAKNAIGLYCDGSLTFDNIKINFVTDTEFAANGRIVLITDTVTFTNRIKIFGGGRGTSVSGNTDLTVLGGIYNRIYGGSFSGSVSGDVNLTVGGNVNFGDGINDDDSATLSPCLIYGGCYNGTVGGDVNVNFGGNAVAYYLSGAGGDANDTVSGDININITGGKVMNVYGSRTAAINTDVNIKMTGGLAEAVFGGGESVATSGSATVYIGGTADISRRVYGGCYNNWELFGGWSSSRTVNGQTTVIIDGTACKIASGTGLSSGNKSNSGLFAGSRVKSNAASEQSTLIFLNGSYNTFKNKIGDTSGWSSTFKSHHDRIITSGVGGTVEKRGDFNTLTLLPDEGNVATIGGIDYADGTEYTMSESTVNVTFKAFDGYTVLFDYNDGTGTVKSVPQLNGEAIEIPTAESVNKRLVGWATVMGSSDVKYTTGSTLVLTEDITLYAIWEVGVYFTVVHWVENADGELEIVKSEQGFGAVGEKAEITSLNLVGYTAYIPNELVTDKEVMMIFVTYLRDGSAQYDINCDGSIDMLDVVLLKRSLAGWSGYDETKVCDYNSDCDGNGTVDIADVVVLTRHLAGWENP